MLIIGESINCAIPKVSDAIIARDEVFISALAKQQIDCGAEMLDVFAALPGRNQTEDMLWTVQVVQQTVDVPLVLDSPDPKMIKEALAICKKQPIISSITAEEYRSEEILPLVAENGCGLVALCMNEEGIPNSAEDRIKVAELIVERAVKAGVKEEQLWFDPMVLGIGTDAASGMVTLETLTLLRKRLPRVHTLGGVSNVSFGMPNRRLLNRAFLAMLMDRGLEGLMIDVRDEDLMSILRAAAALTGVDDCREYLKAYRAGKLKK
jgi:cobalamin-dependent methionine synthase I